MTPCGQRVRIASQERETHMSFMQAQARYIAMFVVETTNGTEFVPSGLVGDNPVHGDFADYVEGDVLGEHDLALAPGWYARFSAPGYMDRTDWTGPYETERAALVALAEMHEVCETCFENCEDSPAGACK